MSDFGSVSNPSGSTLAWASSSHASNYIPGVTTPSISIFFSDRGPCPVCGNATGDCTGDEPGIESSVTFERKVKDPNATFTVPRRIYRTVLKGKRQIRQLLYAPGDRITPAEARRLGLIPPIVGQTDSE